MILGKEKFCFHIDNKEITPSHQERSMNTRIESFFVKVL